MQKHSFFPRRMTVTFRKGPLGYLRQDRTDAARLLKDNSSLQDQHAPVKEAVVKQNALTVVRMRGGDASDRTEVAGEYILQFGKYKGKSFRWLLENDIGIPSWMEPSPARPCTPEGCTFCGAASLCWGGS
ncbi:Macrophage mannose receptor 1 [Dissostichus eleginoides]|uniref:Macrophage mannose receptor 1 n=1 Tax=Dissostichus eleginoides TaxID=100907 RepID=A0AAD9F0F4_DISEL|nr:Macrophage mannose receptor 1 [Dissostichus eleginoides]